MDACHAQSAMDAACFSWQWKVMIADLIPAKHYTKFEDVQGILLASAQAALGLYLLRAAGLMTGGTAGVALILAQLFHWNFSLTFFLLNLPFFALAYRLRGAVFCLKNLSTVVIVSLLAEALKPLLDIGSIHPGAAAVIFGVSTGVGLLGLFRHGASLGGVSIIALVLQDRYGLKAAWTQLAHDGILFGIAVFVLPLPAVLWSLLGTVILNAVIAFNHRRDWYVVS